MIRGLAWDDRPEELQKLAEHLHKTYDISLEIESDQDQFVHRFAAREHDPWDFVVVDMMLAAIHEGDAPMPVGGKLVRQIRTMSHDIPVFIITAAPELVYDVNLGISWPWFVISKSDLVSVMASDLQHKLAHLGVYVDRRKVFLVYGHDREAMGSREEVVDFLTKEKGLVVDTVSSEDLYTEILEGLVDRMRECAAVIIMCTPDDLCDSGQRYQPRANVLIELGLALGLKQGLKRVVILQRWGKHPKSKAVLPSDFGGVLTIRFGEYISHAFDQLTKRLKKAGLEID